MKKMLLLVTTIIAVLALGACVALQHPAFGSLPAGAQRTALEASPNYRDGEFRNLLPTPILSDGSSSLGALVRGRFEKRERLAPSSPMPVVKTDLRSLPPEEDTVVWLGHSSYYVQMGGRRILIDPVFSDHAAPFSWMVPAFEGTSVYRVEDLPAIDVLLITHDHGDRASHWRRRARGARRRAVQPALGLHPHEPRGSGAGRLDPAGPYRPAGACGALCAGQSPLGRTLRPLGRCKSRAAVPAADAAHRRARAYRRRAASLRTLVERGRAQRISCAPGLPIRPGTRAINPTQTLTDGGTAS